MIDRRTFAALMAGTWAASASSAWGQPAAGRTILYASVGPRLTAYDIDIAGAALTARRSVTLPSNVQYAWPHPSRRFLYVVSSSGAPGFAGDHHVASAWRIDPASGALETHGSPQALPYRPIHISVDGAGQYAMISYIEPSHLSIHRINDDGTLGGLVNQPNRPDVGIYAHQLRTTPSNRTAILVTRGNNATSTKPEDPGALKVFGFKDGVLTNLASIAPNKGLGFGPRHLDFHPTLPFVFVSLERQNKLHVFRLQTDGTLLADPVFVKETLADPNNVRAGQQAGTIHVHPNGRFVYQANRNADIVDDAGRKVFAGGENSIAVFAIDQGSGEPTLIQNAPTRGFQPRTFSLDPSGRMLVAANIMPLEVRKERDVAGGMISAGLSTYRVGDDGKLTFARKYDVDTGGGQLFWSGLIKLA
jgi:6-phosphogluconolactonase